MKVKISSEILKKYREVNKGIIISKNLNNQENQAEKPIDLLIKQAQIDKKQEINQEEILEIPSIAKWREIYRSFGAKPSKFRNSAEALIRRILKTDLYKINNLVDIYNYISIKYILTIGGEDIDQLKGDLILDFAKGDEEFIPLGETENQPPWKGEVIYKDGEGAICRCWNYREADRTKLTKGTKNAIIVIENMLPEKNKEFQQALEESKQLIEKYCDADCEVKILNKENPEIST